MKRLLDFFTLFTSLSTLICCALPALIVALGMGAAMAGFLTKYPQLIWISENKFWLFLIGGVLLGLGGFLQFRVRNQACPIEEIAQACQSTRDSSRVLYIISVIVYLVGLSFAYILPRFM